MHRVFVYGTLRPGGRNRQYLEAASHCGPHVTAARFTLLDTGPYPAAVTNGATAIVGDVFAVSDKQLRRLDVLEDYPRLYTRELIDTPFGKAWMYLWIAPRGPGWPVIPDGDWRGHRNHEPSHDPS